MASSKMKKYVLLVLAIFCSQVQAETLTTRTYEIQVGSCPEGHVTCNNIRFKVHNLLTGNVSVHVGETLHTLCADGTTPCRFAGYQFQGDQRQFTLYVDGTLIVNYESINEKQVEEGEWSYQDGR